MTTGVIIIALVRKLSGCSTTSNVVLPLNKPTLLTRLLKNITACEWLNVILIGKSLRKFRRSLGN